MADQTRWSGDRGYENRDQWRDQEHWRDRERDESAYAGVPSRRYASRPADRGRTWDDYGRGGQYDQDGPYGAGGDWAYGEGVYGPDRARYMQRARELYGSSEPSRQNDWSARRLSEPSFSRNWERERRLERDERSRADEDRTWWDRTSDEVSSWFGDRDAERRREMDSARPGDHRGRGPKGYARSDDRIREDVNDRLTDDAWLDASLIEVRVENGEVTLSGAVDSRSDKRRAEDIADRVTGVKHVQNNLRLRQREEAQTAAMGDESTITGATTLRGRTQ